MPKVLEPGVLYVSQEFKTAAHLCACGCGEKVRTPLGATEWKLTDAPNGPSLYPSIGNWQQSCRSHYWIRCGEIVWAEDWSQEQVENARQHEMNRRRDHYDRLYPVGRPWWRRIWDWMHGR